MEILLFPITLVCSCLPVFLSPADKLVGRLILGLQRRNVSQGLILLNLSSDHFIFYPRSRILQQKCLVAFFFPVLFFCCCFLRFLQSSLCWFLLFNSLLGCCFSWGLLSPVLSHSPWWDEVYFHSVITSLFPTTIILLSCL